MLGDVQRTGNYKVTKYLSIRLSGAPPTMGAAHQERPLCTSSVRAAVHQPQCESSSARTKAAPAPGFKPCKLSPPVGHQLTSKPDHHQVKSANFFASYWCIIVSGETASQTASGEIRQFFAAYW